MDAASDDVHALRIVVKQLSAQVNEVAVQLQDQREWVKADIDSRFKTLEFDLLAKFFAPMKSDLIEVDRRCKEASKTCGDHSDQIARLLLVQGPAAPVAAVGAGTAAGAASPGIIAEEVARQVAAAVGPLREELRGELSDLQDLGVELRELLDASRHALAEELKQLLESRLDAWRPTAMDTESLQVKHRTLELERSLLAAASLRTADDASADEAAGGGAKGWEAVAAELRSALAAQARQHDEIAAALPAMESEHKVQAEDLDAKLKTLQEQVEEMGRALRTEIEDSTSALVHSMDSRVRVEDHHEILCAIRREIEDSATVLLQSIDSRVSRTDHEGSLRTLRNVLTESIHDMVQAVEISTMQLAQRTKENDIGIAERCEAMSRSMEDERRLRESANKVLATQVQADIAELAYRQQEQLGARIHQLRSEQEAICEAHAAHLGNLRSDFMEMGRVQGDLALEQRVRSAAQEAKLESVQETMLATIQHQANISMEENRRIAVALENEVVVRQKHIETVESEVDALRTSVPLQILHVRQAVTDFRCQQEAQLRLLAEDADVRNNQIMLQFEADSFAREELRKDIVQRCTTMTHQVVCLDKAFEALGEETDHRCASVEAAASRDGVIAPALVGTAAVAAAFLL